MDNIEELGRLSKLIVLVILLDHIDLLNYLVEESARIPVIVPNLLEVVLDPDAEACDCRREQHYVGGLVIVGLTLLTWAEIPALPPGDVSNAQADHGEESDEDR